MKQGAEQGEGRKRATAEWEQKTAALEAALGTYLEAGGCYVTRAAELVAELREAGWPVKADSLDKLAEMVNARLVMMHDFRRALGWEGR